ncbi:unnamed protein product [Sphacelaria rigidula]
MVIFVVTLVGWFWGVLMIMHAIVIRPLTSRPYKTGAEHAGFSPDQARTPTTERGCCLGGAS